MTLENNVNFRLNGRLTIDATEVAISNNLETGDAIALTGSVVLRDRRGQEIERGIATAASGTLTFSSRGITPADDDTTDTALKKDRPRGTLGYFTAFASQLVDKKVENTFEDHVTLADTKKVYLGGGTTAYVVSENGGTDLKFKDGSNAEKTLTQLASLSGSNDKVKISSNDTTEDFLVNKVTGGDGITVTETTDGGNETLDIDLDITDTTKFVTTKTAGKVPVLDGNGEIDDFLSDNVKLKGDYTVTAGENLSAGDVVRFGVSYAGSSATVDNTGISNIRLGYDSTETHGGQSITIATGGKLTSITTKIKEVGSPTGGIITCKIYDSAGGNLLETSTNTLDESTLSTSSPGLDRVFTFSSDFVYADSQQVFVKFELTGRANSTSNYSSLLYENTGTYTGGQAFRVNGSDTWSAISGGDVRMSYIVGAYSTEDTSKLYKSSALSSAVNSIDGIVSDDIATDATGKIDIFTNNSQSSLTYGTTYYLSNTAGAISASAGNTSVEVGKGLDATTLYIKSLY